MKAIIIAAGVGRRLFPLTDQLPKCLAIKKDGKSLFEMQLEALRQNGITDISVIRGYQAEKFTFSDVRYFVNRDYADNNILESLFCAEEAIQGDLLVLYSDVWFSPHLISQLLMAKEDIVIGMRRNWKEDYDTQTIQSYEEAELVSLKKSDNTVEHVGKIFHHHKDISGEFLGMVKLTPAGADTFRRYYRQSREDYLGKPFHRSKTFRQAYLTDFFQEMAEKGERVYGKFLEGDWCEIDTIEDYHRLQSLFKKKGGATC